MILVGRFAHPRGVDEGPIVLGELRICPVDLRVPDVGFQDAGFQIVDQQALGHPFVELDHRDVALDPRLLVLRVGELDEGKTAAGQLGGEGVHTASLPAAVIEQSTDGAVVDCYSGSTLWSVKVSN